MANLASPTIEELKHDIDELMSRELKVDSTAAAVAALVEKVEVIRSALQAQVETRSRAEEELLAATERLRESIEFYRVFEGVVRNCLVRNNMVTAIESARHYHSRAHDHVAKNTALQAQLTHLLQIEETKLDFLETALTKLKTATPTAPGYAPSVSETDQDHTDVMAVNVMPLSAKDEYGNAVDLATLTCT